MEYRFCLDNSRPIKLFTCPGCGKKSFKRYIDNEARSYLHDNIGRCNREVNCGYHLTPKGNVYTETFSSANRKAIVSTPPTITDYVEQDVFEKTLGHYQRNHFYLFLVSHFGERAEAAAHQFHLGTSKHWTGATIFWQVDSMNRIRTGKIMLYNPSTGRRVKEPFSHITWVHRLLTKNNTYDLNQCFFGEHQLIHASNEPTIGIVESEKTAIIASIMMPELIWLACGSISNLSRHKFSSIANRRIILYPDLNAFERWMSKANELRAFNLDIHVSDLIEKSARAAERAGGWDLADYLLRTGQGY